MRAQLVDHRADALRGRHLTHPDSLADGGPPHAQNAAREPDSD
jgi:hypothetical protein